MPTKKKQGSQKLTVIPKSHCNSIQSQADIRARLAKNEEVTCPIPLNIQELESFNQIVSSYPINTWDDHRARMAGQLARMMVLSEQLHEDAEKYGSWYTNEKGDFKEHPAYNGYLKSLMIIQSLSRSLGLTAVQLGIRKKDLGSQIVAEREAQLGVSKASIGFLA